MTVETGPKTATVPTKCPVTLPHMASVSNMVKAAGMYYIFVFIFKFT